MKEEFQQRSFLSDENGFFRLFLLFYRSGVPEAEKLIHFLKTHKLLQICKRVVT